MSEGHGRVEISEHDVCRVIVWGLSTRLETARCVTGCFETLRIRLEVYAIIARPRVWRMEMGSGPVWAGACAIQSGDAHYLAIDYLRGRGITANRKLVGSFPRHTPAGPA